MLKHLVRRIARAAFYRAELEAIAAARWAGLSAHAHERGIIFGLHHVAPREPRFDPAAPLSVTPDHLDDTIVAALRAGLTPVHLEDLPDLLEDVHDPRRFVCFTLDDGYRDNMEHAAPVFRRHGVPYTIFVTEGFVERTRSMWWETAREVVRSRPEITFRFDSEPTTLRCDTTPHKVIAYERLAAHSACAVEDDAVASIDELGRANGVDPTDLVDRLAMDADDLRRLLESDPLVRFGAHTRTHVNLSRVGADRLRDEVVGSMAALERFTGRRPKAFAYPYGGKNAVGAREIEAVADAGFEIGVTTQPTLLSDRTLDERTAIGRVDVKGDHQKPRFADALVSGLPARIRW